MAALHSAGVRSTQALIVFAWLMLTGPAAAVEQEDVPPSLTIDATMMGDNPYGPPSEEFGVTVFVRGDQSRIDVAGEGNQRGMLLRTGTGEAWMISLDQGVAMPSDAPGIGDLLVDPGQPCAHMGSRCQPLGSRFIAGRPAKGWRYRDADGRGPAGTSDGKLWVDPNDGVVLGYEGTRRGRKERFAMEVRTISRASLPDAVFELPDVVRAVED